MIIENADPASKNRLITKNKIAAIVVTFNRKELLLECIHSLINQTYCLDTIFIIDGPSTDGTPEHLLECNLITELPPDVNNIK